LIAGAGSWKCYKRVKDTTAEYFIFDGDNVLASYDSGGNLNASYLTPGLDANLSMTNSTDTYYYFADGLGSIRNVVESDEDIANTYDYRAFGILITETENVDSPFEFTGRAREPGGLSHMHYYRNRYYMPGNGIFTSRDAMWADVHRGWGYVGNWPTGQVDQYGLVECPGGAWICRGSTWSAGLIYSHSWGTITCKCSQRIEIGSIDWYTYCCDTGWDESAPDVQGPYHQPVYARAYCEGSVTGNSGGISAGFGKHYFASKVEDAPTSDDLDPSGWGLNLSASLGIASGGITVPGFDPEGNVGLDSGGKVDASIGYSSVTFDGCWYAYEFGPEPALSLRKGQCVKKKANITKELD